MPPIHERNTWFWKLLHDVEKPLTLKDAVDNLKNYGIASGSFILGMSVYKHSSGATRSSGVLALVIASGLLVATFSQSWVLAQKGVFGLWEMSVAEQYEMKGLAILRFLILAAIPILLFVTVLSVGKWYMHAHGG